MKEMTSSQESSHCGPAARKGSSSRRIRSSFHGMSPFIGLHDVCEDHSRHFTLRRVAIERVIIFPVSMGAVTVVSPLGRNFRKASVIMFSQFAIWCSSELATGKKVPSIISSCEVLGTHLQIVSCRQLVDETLSILGIFDDTQRPLR